MPGSTCALCLNSAGLKNSHIIPEFMYEALYDNIHRFRLVSVANANEEIKQKGLREALLCEQCEQRFSIHEKYVSELMSGKNRVNFLDAGEPGSQLVRVEGLNYRHFKLFGLSILWRAGVSAQDFFSFVRLGAHQERLRRLLLADDPGSSLQYPFVVAPILGSDHPHVPTTIITQPQPTRFAGHWAYNFIFGEIVWTFLVSSHSLVPPLADAILNEKGAMLMRMSHIREIPFIERSLLELERAIRR